MKMPFFLMISTRGAPSGASMSTPSRLSLAMAHDLLWLAGDLGVGAAGRRYVLTGGLGVNELDDGRRRFHAVGVGVLVVAQVVVGEPGELVLVVVHVVEEVDSICEGAAGLDCLVGTG